MLKKELFFFKKIKIYDVKEMTINVMDESITFSSEGAEDWIVPY